MQYAVELAIGICALLIGYVYPFIAVFRGGLISEAIGKSWGMQLVYFIGLCFGVPTLGGYFGKEVADTLVDWVPEPRIIVAVVMGGWTAPLLAGWFAKFVRRKLHREKPVGV